MSSSADLIAGSASLKKISPDVRKMMCKVNKDQLDQLRRDFLEKDVNGDGTLSRDEFRSLMLEEDTYSEDEVSMMMSALDIDNTESIDFAEYIAYIAQDFYGESHSPNEVEVNCLFTFIDRNGDGKVTKAELRTGLATIGYVLDDAQIDLIWTASEGTKGELDKSEFVNMVKAFGKLAGM